MKPSSLGFLLAATAATIPAQAQSMTDLGIFAGGSNSNAHGVSADGFVVVGNGNISGSWSHASRWTSSGMTDLGTLPGGTYSYASGVSADGSVIVGESGSSAGSRAFLWTSSGMTDLGTLSGGSSSSAKGVSADGYVVVGYSSTSSGNRAFRWTLSGMMNLGTLGGGSNSMAHEISADGSVIVGESGITGGYSRAFRWTTIGGMINLGTFIGGNLSTAYGVSEDGSVVVGYSNDAGGFVRAFRWTSAGGLTDLGALIGGNNSHAQGVSADGSTVVGYADLPGGNLRAFRWTAASGMTDLGTLPGGSQSYAYGVSADGNVVVGQSGSNAGDRAFLYTHRVMLDVQDWLGSVGGVNSLLSSSLELSRSFMEGAHHRPLAELGRGRSYWVTGDIASSSRTRDLRTRSGEAGATFEPAANVLIGIGAGYGRQERDLANGGSGATNGQYLVGEIDLVQDNGGIFSLLLSAGDWHNKTDRAYVTGSGIDSSHGETDLASTAFRVRYDSPILVRAYATDLKAYVSYSQSSARSDAYVETGGSYAGSFGGMEQTAKEGRLGVAATRALGDKLRLRLSAEWIRRFDDDQAMLTATDITSTLELSLPGMPVVRDQARFGLDLDYLMDAKTTLSFTVHAAGRGESADVSGAISLRRAF
jgi:probable HAF family extracellular repeat protein